MTMTAPSRWAERPPDSPRRRSTGSEPSGGSGDTLVGRGERHAHVPAAGPTVERPGRDEDAQAGECGDGLPAVLVPRRPEVQRPLGVVDPEPRPLQARTKHRAPGRVARVLLVRVDVI